MTDRLTGHWLSSYLHYTRRTECPRLFKKWAGIAAIASVLGRRVYLDWDSLLFPNMYILFVGPAGCGKGTAYREVRAMLNHFRETVSICSDSTTREGFLAYFASCCREVEGMPENYDSKLITPMTVMSPEFSVFIAKYRDDLLPDITDLFDSSEMWSYRPKQAEPALLYGVCLNLVGLTTPSALHSLLPTEAVGGGFTSRCIIVFGDKTRGPAPWQKGAMNPFPKKHQTERELAKALVADLETIHALKGEFTYTEEWKNLYEGWRIDFEANPPKLCERFDGYLSLRRCVQFLKLQMILSVCQRDDLVLDGTVFAEAVATLNEVEQPMNRVFYGHGENPTARLMPKVWERVASRGKVRLTDLLSELLADAPMREVKEVVWGMVMSKALKREVEIVNGENVVWLTPGTDPALLRKRGE